MNAPYDKDGNLLHYPDTFYRHNGMEWKDEGTFTETLVFEGQRRGRSAAYFVWRKQLTDITYPMFMKDLGDLIKTTTVDRGVVTGSWTVQKRGTNYGIRFVGS